MYNKDKLRERQTDNKRDCKQAVNQITYLTYTTDDSSYSIRIHKKPDSYQLPDFSGIQSRNDCNSVSKQY